MVHLNDELIKYRRQTFRSDPEKSLNNLEQALDFVNERGFIFFWPIKGMTFPSLWTATAGDRPVPNNHDDPAHVTWGWKDSSLGMKMWYYAKVLRYKATFISLDVLPYFYALSDNYGSPEADYLIAYQEGHLSRAEKLIYELILERGPMHTIELRQAIHLRVKVLDYEFNRALEKLQSDFKILPVGIAEAGAWKYAFIYDLTTNHFPDLTNKAHLITDKVARRKIMELFFLSMGASSEKDFLKLFRWETSFTHQTLESLVDERFLIKTTLNEPKDADLFILPLLID